MIDTITTGKFKNYKKICEYLNEPIKTGKSKQLQLEDWKRYFEYVREGNAFVITKVYDVPKEKVRKVIADTSKYISNNRKNIQPMIDYLQAKFDLDDNWYSFTDWYCEKLELMYKGIANAMYHDDEIDAVCEKENISDGKLFFEYVSAAKSELKNMFLKALGYLEKKDKVTYYDEYRFFYQLGERTTGYVTTGCLNERVNEVETIVCNDMNEEHNMSSKMKGRQLLKIIYNNKKYTEEFKEFCLYTLNDDDEVLEKLNTELSAQCPTFHPDCGSICFERPLISYYRGIWISDMELFELNATKIRKLGLEITNKIRTKVRRTLRKSYRKFMKQSDLKAIEKALFQHFDENLDDGFGIDLSEDDISELDEIFAHKQDSQNQADDNWGEPIDFTIEEMLDMPVEGEVSTPNGEHTKTDDCKELDYID